jgi:hypothetical protein
MFAAREAYNEVPAQVQGVRFAINHQPNWTAIHLREGARCAFVVQFDPIETNLCRYECAIEIQHAKGRRVWACMQDMSAGRNSYVLVIANRPIFSIQKNSAGPIQAHSVRRLNCQIVAIKLSMCDKR